MSSTFAELGVPQNLLAVLDRAGITTPTPIQTATLPDAMAGRDVLGRGRTGSGKTYAFCLPLVARLAASRNGRPRRGAPRGLVLAPTRELARQIDETLAPLAKAAGMSTTVIFGGVPQGRQVSALERGVDIVVACPGRLEDLMGQRYCSLDQVEVTVLDEADHMADLGFLPAVRRILKATPSGRQRLLFSATLDRGVDALVRQFLSDPVTHSVDDGTATAGDTDHHLLGIGAGDRVRVVAELASQSPRTVVFTRTKRGARQLARTLTERGTPSVDLHGNLSQNARVRNLEAFSSGKSPVLVATDIAARGIHVDDVGLVIHADPPTEHKAYVHRSGRTARAGAVGTVVTLATDQQQAEVRSLLKAAGVRAARQQIGMGGAVSLGASTAAPADEASARGAAPAADKPGRQNQGSGSQQGSGGGRSRRRRGRGPRPGAGEQPRSTSTGSAQSRPANGSTQRAANGSVQRPGGSAQRPGAGGTTRPTASGSTQPRARRHASRPQGAPASQQANRGDRTSA